MCTRELVRFEYSVLLGIWSLPASGLWVVIDEWLHVLRAAGREMRDRAAVVVIISLDCIFG